MFFSDCDLSQIISTLFDVLNLRLSANIAIQLGHSIFGFRSSTLLNLKCSSCTSSDHQLESQDQQTGHTQELRYSSDASEGNPELIKTANIPSSTQSSTNSSTNILSPSTRVTVATT
ncbi:hypothetical protein PGTUg99_002547 [Puccinia graminis f. sp. tritici]|nr:hypothetical protein PGTUg99_002547 [Puccinia graminis f. sp. tritici]